MQVSFRVSNHRCHADHALLLSDPYPFAIDECFDVYRTLIETAGRIIGMSGSKLNVIFSGDSAFVPASLTFLAPYLKADLSRTAAALT